MIAEHASRSWSVECECGEAILQGQGVPIQIAICHCNDCRTARGGDASTHTLVLVRRDQLTTAFDGIKAVSGSEYLDLVPRYFCDSCGDWMVGDCTSIGFDMALLPRDRISSQRTLGEPDYHMHLEQKITEPPKDGLPRFQGNPEDPYMAELIEKCANGPL